jgi:NADPH2:quinone reductase
VIRGAWSSINYKDALAATGKGKILRRYPLVGGVDIAGTVESSTDPRFQAGDKVVVGGCGLSETTDGGFTQLARVPGDFVNPLPAGLDLRSAMAIGTAGFTAALALHRMEQNGQRPDLGPIAVTGATGGVGSVAIDIFSRRGYAVTALTHKAGAEEYLRSLGATEVQVLAGMMLGTRPLEKAVWGGAVDNLGGEVLAWLTRTTAPLGNIASIGLAAGPELNTTVMPFILRGVSLLGIDSVMCPGPQRKEAWARLARDLPLDKLDAMTTTATLGAAMGLAEQILKGQVRGRTVIEVRG